MAYAEVLASQLRQNQGWLTERQSLGEQILKNAQPLPRIQADMTIDGYARDWAEMVDESRWYGRNELRSVSENQPWSPQSLSLRQLAARDDNYAYLLLMVRDDQRFYRRQNYLRIDLNDHVELVTLDDNGAQRRYLFAPQAEGRVEAQRMADDPNNWVPQSVDPELRAEWRETDGGYNFELRMPLRIASAGIGFAVADMDNSTQQPPLTSIGSTALELKPGFSANTQPAPLPNAIAETFDSLPVRLWLLDSLGRIVAVGGQPQAAMAAHAMSDNRLERLERAPGQSLVDRWLTTPLTPWWQRRYRQLQQSHWGKKIAAPSRWRQGRWPEQQPAAAEHIKLAQQGQPAARWQPGNVDGLWLVSAAVPLAMDSVGSRQPPAVVVAEQWQAGSQLLLQPGTVRLLSLALVSAIAALLGCLLMAVVLIWRLRRVQAAQAEELVGMPLTGDALSRLRQGAERLVAERNAAGRVLREQKQQLSRSLQTPLAVISSSLELAEVDCTDAQRSYFQSARQASRELNGMLEVLSAEQRAQKLLEEAEPISIDLSELVQRSVENWLRNNPQFGVQMSLPNGECHCVTVAGPLPLAINQMLNYAALLGSGLQLCLEPVGATFRISIAAEALLDNVPPPITLADTIFSGLGGQLLVDPGGKLPLIAELPAFYTCLA